MTLNEQSVVGKGVVIGAGTMGGGIAAQLANAGWQVTLLDVANPDAAPSDPKARNQAAEAGLERVKKNRPPLLFLPEFAARIRIGNTEDDLQVLRDADWIVEAVAEKMEVKRAVMARIEAHAGPHAVVSSNTSGLSLAGMTEGRSDAFRARFLGTHFLNPPRYLKLLEVVALPSTDPEVAAGFARFAEQVLGHRVVFARDTPGFISTRLWIMHLLDTMAVAARFGLTVEEADALTGPLLGRPRSATFRMADLVGLDIVADIAANQYAHLPNDPYRERLILPDWMQALIASGRLGDKTGGGFYRREGGASRALDLNTLEYRPRQEVDLPEVKALQALPLPARFEALGAEVASDAPAWRRFLREILTGLTDYAARVGPEIAADVLAIDNVMRWGFHWEQGPFEIADRMADGADSAVAPGGERRGFHWELGPFVLESGGSAFAPRNYGGDVSARTFRVFGEQALRRIPETPEYLSLAELKAAGKLVQEDEVASLIDLGDGVLCLEYHTKMNTFSPALTAAVEAARERAEREFAALVIGNQGPHFSAGYNLNLFLERMAAEDWSGIDALLRDVQFAFLGLKYARVPVVAAVHGYTLGAGCEGALYCVAVQAAPELAMGLPEMNVGVLPAGGGTTALLVRAISGLPPGADPFPEVEGVLNRLIYPRNSGSAAEAKKMGLLRDTDGLTRNADRLIYDAKARALGLANSGYQPPVKQSVRAGGADMLARLRVPIHWAYRAGTFTEHDRQIADRVAWVLSGGDLPHAQEVSEEYLLRLEREAFIALAREPKSAARMRHVLETGKPLRN
jgi:3-hydroxyacyl-CoA dehydrogenase